jgi:TolA-binding protein
LTAFPAEARAPRAAFSIGESYQARGKTTEALDAFDQLLKEDGIKVETDQARRDWAEVAMAASFQVGMILQAQERFAEAIAAWKGYLARFPNGPQSADAFAKLAARGATSITRTRSMLECLAFSSRSARASQRRPSPMRRSRPGIS